MRLFPPEPEISDDEGFSPDKDIFGRAEFGLRLTNLVRSLEDPSVLLLDAPWGAGKSTFIRMWRGELRKLGVPTVYFDAFASDYMTDPFLALAGEVLDLAEEREPSKAKVAKFKNKATAVGRVLLKHGANFAVRAATLNAVDASSLGDAGAEIEKALSEKSGAAVEELVKDRLEGHRKERASFSEFRNTLAELAATLPEGEPEEIPKPLVFIIDELDRCRPPFALALLETVKHFFNVDGVVFLLVTNLAQLANSVRFAYGSQIEAGEYLEKFYHLRLTLPKPQERHALEGKYFRHIFSFLPDDDDGGQYSRSLSRSLSYFARRRGYSLRRLERIGALAGLFIAATSKRYIRFEPLVAGLAVLRMEEPQLFDKAKSMTLGFAEANEILGISAWKDDEDGDGPGRWGHMIWTFCLDASRLNEDERRAVNSSLFQYHVRSGQDMLRLMAGMMDELHLNER